MHTYVWCLLLLKRKHLCKRQRPKEHERKRDSYLASSKREKKRANRGGHVIRRNVQAHEWIRHSFCCRHHRCRRFGHIKWNEFQFHELNIPINNENGFTRSNSLSHGNWEAVAAAAALCRCDPSVVMCEQEHQQCICQSVCVCVWLSLIRIHCSHPPMKFDSSARSAWLCRTQRLASDFSSSKQQWNIFLAFGTILLHKSIKCAPDCPFFNTTTLKRPILPLFVYRFLQI